MKRQMHYGIPTVVNVVLGQMAAAITHNLTTIVQTDPFIPNYYRGTTEEVDAQLAQEMSLPCAKRIASSGKFLLFLPITG